MEAVDFGKIGQAQLRIKRCQADAPFVFWILEIVPTLWRVRDLLRVVADADRLNSDFRAPLVLKLRNKTSEVGGLRRRILDDQPGFSGIEYLRRIEHSHVERRLVTLRGRQPRDLISGKHDRLRHRSTGRGFKRRRDDIADRKSVV